MKKDRLERLFASIKQEVDTIRATSHIHVCAPLCYCGSTPTPKSEREAMQMKITMLERTVAKIQEVAMVDDPLSSSQSGSRVVHRPRV